MLAFVLLSLVALIGVAATLGLAVLWQILFTHTEPPAFDPTLPTFKDQTGTPRFRPQARMSAGVSVVSLVIVAIVLCGNGFAQSGAMRTDAAQRVVSGSASAGLVASGRRLVRESGKLACVQCHGFESGDESGLLHLSDAGRRLSREELILAVLAPSLTIHPDFPVDCLALANGRILEGRVQESHEDFVIVRLKGGKLLTVLTAEIEARTRIGSQMPAGLINELTRDEFEALIAYLESLQSS